MRFVRAYTIGGQLINVSEQEVPFEVGFGIVVEGATVEMHEIGFVEDFEPDGLDGKPCSPAKHLMLRMEREPGGNPARGFRAKPGHTLPVIHDCPTSLPAIRQRLRDRGLAGIPVKARAWLTLMLPTDEVTSMGIGAEIPISALIALESIRTRRDPNGGSRIINLERKAQRQNDERKGIFK